MPTVIAGAPKSHAARATGTANYTRRTIRDVDAGRAEAAIDLGQAQSLGQPLADRRSLWTEALELRARRGHVRRPPRAARGGDRSESRVGRWRPASPHARRDRGPDIGGDRFPVHPRRARSRGRPRRPAHTSRVAPQLQRFRDRAVVYLAGHTTRG